jgi:hypothetical protein
MRGELLSVIRGRISLVPAPCSHSHELNPPTDPSSQPSNRRQVVGYGAESPSDDPSTDPSADADVAAGDNVELLKHRNYWTVKNSWWVGTSRSLTATRDPGRRLASKSRVSLAPLADPQPNRNTPTATLQPTDRPGVTRGATKASSASGWAAAALAFAASPWQLPTRSRPPPTPPRPRRGRRRPSRSPSLSPSRSPSRRGRSSAILRTSARRSRPAAA